LPFLAQAFSYGGGSFPTSSSSRGHGRHESELAVTYHGGQAYPVHRAGSQDVGSDLLFLILGRSGLLFYLLILLIFLLLENFVSCLSDETLLSPHLEVMMCRVDDEDERFRVVVWLRKEEAERRRGCLMMAVTDDKMMVLVWLMMMMMIPIMTSRLAVMHWNRRITHRPLPGTPSRAAPGESSSRHSLSPTTAVSYHSVSAAKVV
jgi:hypothetical protein